MSVSIRTAKKNNTSATIGKLLFAKNGEYIHVNLKGNLRLFRLGNVYYIGKFFFVRINVA